MTTDNARNGICRQFEDFMDTAIADQPEIDVQGTADIVAGKNGRIRLTTGTGNDDARHCVSGNLNWYPGQGELFMEARILLSALTDNMYFVGFGDSLASSNETHFDALADAVTIGTQSDGFGILFDNDATTKNLWCVAAKTDTVTVGKVLSSVYNPTASAFVTLGCSLSTDRKVATYFVNGEEVYKIISATTLVAAVPLCWMVAAYAQATALSVDVDWVDASIGRSAS